MQIILVSILIVAALVYLIWRFSKTWKGKKGCDSCAVGKIREK